MNKFCHSCGAELNSWDTRCSKALVYKNALCERCIVKEYEISKDEFRDIMEHHFDLRPCRGI